MKIHDAYFAGIIDGEGSITLNRTGPHKVDGMWASYTVKLSVANTSRKLLDALQAQYGGAIYRAMAQERMELHNQKDAYHLQWFGKNAKPLILAIQPYLIIKSRQAELALAVIAIQKARKSGVAQSADEVRVIRDMQLEMKALNKRGR